MQELKKEFDKQNPPLVLAAAISGYKEVIEVAYDLSGLGNALDFMSVMSYDYHGAWEPQTGHVSPLYKRAEDKYPQYNVVSIIFTLCCITCHNLNLLELHHGVLGIPRSSQGKTSRRCSNVWSNFHFVPKNSPHSQFA